MYLTKYITCVYNYSNAWTDTYSHMYTTVRTKAHQQQTTDTCTHVCTHADRQTHTHMQCLHTLHDK